MIKKRSKSKYMFKKKGEGYRYNWHIIDSINILKNMNIIDYDTNYNMNRKPITFHVNS